MQKVTIKVEAVRQGESPKGTFIVERRQRDVWNRVDSKDIGLPADASQTFTLGPNERLVFQSNDPDEVLVYDRDQASAIRPSQQGDVKNRADQPRIVPPLERPANAPLSPTPAERERLKNEMKELAEREKMPSTPAPVPGRPVQPASVPTGPSKTAPLSDKATVKTGTQGAVGTPVSSQPNRAGTLPLDSTGGTGSQLEQGNPNTSAPTQPSGQPASVGSQTGKPATSTGETDSGQGARDTKSK